MRLSAALNLFVLLPFASPALCQGTADPFPTPIEAVEGVILVNFVEFDPIPDIAGVTARLMTAVTEPATRRIFVSDMRGPIYTLGFDGRGVRLYLDANDARWGVPVESGGRERGIQSFTLHPEFARRGSPGYGKLYTWFDTSDTQPTPDFLSGASSHTHDTVLLEWSASDATAEVYDGAAPRELMRLRQPFANHNGGHIAFHPFAEPGDPEFGLLYIGVADGGSGGDPLGMGQNLGAAFGKILRIDPLGSNSANGNYGVPANNPFVSDTTSEALGEIYAYGLRNPQRFAWDPVTGNMFVTDIGQNVVEKLSLVPPGGNLGWNTWEGSFRHLPSREVGPASPRGDSEVTFPIAEYDQVDPLIQSNSAASGLHVYRSDEIPRLANRVLWGDLPSGEIFHLPADDLPDGGQASIRRVLFNDGGTARTFLQLIQEKNARQGKTPATRADMRIDYGPDGRVLLLNKHDGTIRMLVP